jgi:hypothetical protein
MLRYRSWAIRAFQTVAFLLPMALGLVQETQVRWRWVPPRG